MSTFFLYWAYRHKHFISKWQTILFHWLLWKPDTSIRSHSWKLLKRLSSQNLGWCAGTSMRLFVLRRKLGMELDAKDTWIASKTLLIGVLYRGFYMKGPPLFGTIEDNRMQTSNWF